MNRLRNLFAAVLAAAVFAYAPPSMAQMPSDALKSAATAADDVGAEGGEDAEAATPANPDEVTEEAPAVAGEAPEADAAADAAADAEASIEDVALEEEPSPWTNGLIMSVAAMCIGGFSAVLGIWVDRDQSRPKVFAASMSFLIVCALVVGVAQGYLDQVDRMEKDQDLERMLDMTYEIAVASGDEALIKLVADSSDEDMDAPAQPADGDGTPSNGSDAGSAQ
jgi:MFS family permease